MDEKKIYIRSTSEKPSARELVQLFNDSVTRSQMENDDFKECFRILNQAASFNPDIEYRAPDYSTAVLIGYCTGFQPPVQTSRRNAQVNPVFLPTLNAVGHVR